MIFCVIFNDYLMVMNFVLLICKKNSKVATKVILQFLSFMHVFKFFGKSFCYIKHLLFACGLILKIQKELDDDCVIKFLRDLNDEFSQVRSQIMLMKPMPSSFPLNSQDFIVNLSFQDSSNTNSYTCGDSFNTR